MRRLTLSTKMLVAALPLIVAVVTLLALSVRNDLSDIDAAEHGAELGGVWNPLIDTMGAIEFEADPANITDEAARTDTNTSVNTLRDSIAVLGATEAAGDHVTSARSALSAARRNLDMATVAPDLQTEIDPAEAYAEAGREIVAIGQLLPAEAGAPELGRELLAVVKLAEAKLSADQITNGVEKWQADPTDLAALANARAEFGVLQTLFGEFEAIAPEEWATEFRQAGFSTSLAGFRSQLDQAARSTDPSAATAAGASFDTAGFEQMVDSIVDYQTSVSNEIVDRANAEAEATSSATVRRIGVILVIVLVALFMAWLISRSITKRIKAVARGANLVSTEQLPALVEAIRDPRGKGVLPEIDPISARGSDELSELATSFNTMQDTLVDVAQEQVEVLRRGVSDIFVTMARRNRSLIDRQLAMLDEFEAEVDDPEVLSNYYQLDHMATRMRRNSESLLVLANAEPKRRRVRATEVDDVVRAAIGEVEDYRRIEIEALESLQVRGNVVADVSHLLAELLDNATSFSPPDSYVRVGGRMSDEGYVIRVVDTGVGISTERLKELNELLREPPVVGLSVESTLGMSVVSLLANKHGVQVTLSSGNPGLIVDVVLPPALFGPIDAEQPAPEPVVATATVVAADAAAVEVEEPTIVEWDDELEAITEDRPVAQGDLRAMSVNLAAFQNGMRTATSASADDAEAADVTDEPEVELVAVAPTTDPGEVASVVDLAAEAEPETDTDDVAVDDTVETVVALTEVADVAAVAEAPEPVPAPAAFSAPTLPPPATPRAEFAVPLAPPITASGPSLRPVTPDNARTVPRPAAPAPAPSLPTRSPSQGPDGGPDRLASALDAALPTRSPGGPGPDGGPDRLSGGAPMPLDAPNGALPSRARVGDPLDPIDEPLATTQSTSDPDALRDRLRAFQAEFRSALGTDAIDQDDADTDQNDLDRDGHDQLDLGGDRR